jgi:hypothetical protein
LQGAPARVGARRLARRRRVAVAIDAVARSKQERTEMPPRSPAPAVLLGVRVPPAVLAEIDAIASRESKGSRKLRRSDVARAAIEAGLRVLSAQGSEGARGLAPLAAPASKSSARAKAITMGGPESPPKPPGDVDGGR